MSSLETNPAAHSSVQNVPAPVVRPEHAEGEISRLIEQQTAKIPSHWFLFAALASAGSSLILELSGQRRASRFVAQWPTPLLVMGLLQQTGEDVGNQVDRSIELPRAEGEG